MSACVYVFMRGGCVQGAVADGDVGLVILDYDEIAEGQTEDDFERQVIGCTYAELTHTATGIL